MFEIRNYWIFGQHLLTFVVFHEFVENSSQFRIYISG